MKSVALIIIQLLTAKLIFAEIAPECKGVKVPADYDEDKQRAFMQNYFSALFMPLPFINWHPSDSVKRNVGVDVSYIPNLSCERRLAIKGTKTENNPKFPVFPRIQVKTELASWNKLSLSLGASILPPVPIANSSIWYGSTQTALSYEPILNLAIHARAFIDLGFVNAEIVSPYNKDDPRKNDWFSFASIGGDATFSGAINLTSTQKLYPFGSIGVIKSASIFVVGIDNVGVPNDKYPLLGLTGFAGVSYHAFNHRLQTTLSIGGVFKTAISGHLQLSYGF